MTTAAVAAPIFHYWRGFPWSLAGLVALALGALAFLAVRAVQNLAAWRPRPLNPDGRLESAPGNGDEAEEEKEVDGTVLGPADQQQTQPRRHRGAGGDNPLVVLGHSSRR